MEYVLRYKLLSTLVTTAHGDVSLDGLVHVFTHSATIMELPSAHVCAVSYRYGKASAAVLYHASGKDRETYSTQCEYSSANPGNLSLSLSLSLSLC